MGRIEGREHVEAVGLVPPLRGEVEEELGPAVPPHVVHQHANRAEVVLHGTRSRDGCVDVGEVDGVWRRTPTDGDDLRRRATRHSLVEIEDGHHGPLPRELLRDRPPDVGCAAGDDHHPPCKSEIHVGPPLFLLRELRVTILIAIRFCPHLETRLDATEGGERSNRVTPSRAVAGHGRDPISAAGSSRDGGCLDQAADILSELPGATRALLLTYQVLGPMVDALTS